MITSGNMFIDPSCVLIVDDERDIREMLARVLELEGYDVRCAADGREALGQLRQGERPGVILLDLMMPIMNGWAFRAEQVRDPLLAAIPVVVLSGHDAVREAAALLGVSAFLQKPIDIDTLLTVVSRHCTSSA